MAGFVRRETAYRPRHVHDCYSAKAVEARIKRADEFEAFAIGQGFTDPTFLAAARASIMEGRA